MLRSCFLNCTPDERKSDLKEGTAQMIVGVNEKLEKKMFSYKDKDDEVECDAVMN